MLERFKRAFLWVVIIVAVVTACFLPTATAQAYYVNDNGKWHTVLDAMERISETEAVLGAFYDCMTYNVGGLSPDSKGVGLYYINNGQIYFFDPRPTSLVNVLTDDYIITDPSNFNESLAYNTDMWVARDGNNNIIGGGWSAQYTQEHLVSDALFKTSNMTTSNAVPVGAAIENTLEGGVNDGIIPCSNKLIDLVLKELKIDINGLICNVNDTNKPGLMRPVTADTIFIPGDYNYVSQKYGTDYMYVKGISGCNAYIDPTYDETVAFVLRPIKERLAYIEELYANFLTKRNKEIAALLATNLSVTMNFSSDTWEASIALYPWQKYFLYLKDYVVACTNGSISDDEAYVKSHPASYYSTPVKIFDADTGQMKQIYFKYNATVKDYAGAEKENWKNSITGTSPDGAHICSKLPDTINGLAEAAQEKFDAIIKKDDRDAAKGACKAKFEARKLIVESQFNTCEYYKDSGAHGFTPEKCNELHNELQYIGSVLNNTNGWFKEAEDGSIVCTPQYGQEEGDTTYTPPDLSDDMLDGGNLSGELGQEDAGTFDGCFGNAGALGWILCPVIRLAGEAVDGIYKSIEDNWLSIEADAIQSPSLNRAWGNFRNYANIFFAIFLVLVILAQVTGIGISNYNIKKILPKLVIAIVLANLSMAICQLAVDLSNIVGSAIHDLLSNMDVGGLAADNLNISTFVENTTQSMLLADVGLVAIGGGITVSIVTGSWPYLLIAILVAFIGALFAIFTFFIILGVRKAAIILLVALSPLAIVCYALPNTQNLAKKWFKVFTDLLVVYPLCGLLMGGGNFASRLLMTAAGSGVDFLYYLIVMLMGVIPFFFIPSILRRSMSALGNIGAKISARGAKIGQTLGHKVNDGITKSRTFQDRQQERLRGIDMRRNSRVAASTKAKIDQLEAKSHRTAREESQLRALKRRNARALSGNRKYHDEEIMAAAMAGGEDYATIPMDDSRSKASIAEIQAGMIEKAAKGYDARAQLDGTANSIDLQQDMLNKALEDLEADAENSDAQARYKTAMRYLSRDDKGREALRKIILERMAAQAAHGNEKNKGLQWASNAALEGANSKEFKTKASELFRVLREGASGTKNFSEIMAGYNADGTINSSSTDAADRYKEGIGSLSDENVTGIDSADLDRYIEGLQNGQSTGDERRRLISSVLGALSNPQMRAKIKPNDMTKFQTIANMRYQEHTGRSDWTGGSSSSIDLKDARMLAGAGEAEIDRLAESFENGTITADDQNGVLNLIERTLNEAAKKDSKGRISGKVDGMELNADSAAKMVEVLKKYRGAAAVKDDYEKLASRTNLATRPDTWRQVTTRDIISNPNLSLNIGDWVDDPGGGAAMRKLNASELEMLQEINKFNVRQRIEESAKSGKPVS